MPTDRYIFLDTNLSESGRSEKSTSYDPRARLWYETALGDGKMSISDVDVFAALDLVGFTIAAPFYRADGIMLGVAAADITLEGMSDYLAESRISPGTVSFILNHQGGVIANSRRRRLRRRRGRAELKHLASLGDDLSAIASLRPATARGWAIDNQRGRRKPDDISAVPRKGLATVYCDAPRISQQLVEQNRQLVIFGLIAILVQIVIIISSPALSRHRSKGWRSRWQRSRISTSRVRWRYRPDPGGGLAWARH